jgi:hypothetical protein
MGGEAGDIPGLDRIVDRAPPARSRWGRRSAGRLETNSGNDRGGPTYAALDLGTNNCRLLVARPAGDGFRVIDAFSRIVRLGEGVSLSGRLSEPAIERALGALAICRNKMRNRGVTRARLIATEACRAAAHGAEFRARVAEEIGLVLEVIDRETEARLAAQVQRQVHAQAAGHRHRVDQVLKRRTLRQAEIVALGEPGHRQLGLRQPRRAPRQRQRLQARSVDQAARGHAGAVSQFKNNSVT